MAFDYYDIPGAISGQSSQTPEERQLRKVRNMIKAAENTNYDGDPEYYGQIKQLAMQAGIPIKQFKTNPYRLAKAGLMSFADTALLGLIPNSMYAAQTPGEEMAIAAGGLGGLLVPWGAPQRLWQLGKGLYKAGTFGKMAGQGGGAKNAWGVVSGRMTPEQFAARGGLWPGSVQSGAAVGGTVNPALQGARVGGAGINQQLAAARGAGGRAVTAESEKLAAQAVAGGRAAGGTVGPMPKIKKAPKQSSAETQAAATKKFQNKNATKQRQKQTADRRKAAKTMNIKMSSAGKLSASQRAKVKALMKPSTYKSYQKLSGKAKKDFLLNWLKQSKIKYTVG